MDSGINIATFPKRQQMVRHENIAPEKYCKRKDMKCNTVSQFNSIEKGNSRWLEAVCA